MQIKSKNNLKNNSKEYFDLNFIILYFVETTIKIHIMKKFKVVFRDGTQTQFSAENIKNALVLNFTDSGALEIVSIEEVE